MHFIPGLDIIGNKGNFMLFLRISTVQKSKSYKSVCSNCCSIIVSSSYSVGIFNYIDSRCWGEYVARVSARGSTIILAY